jgi:YD repeat-containing protein
VEPSQATFGLRKELHTATTVWDPVCGFPSAQTDPNGQTTATQTDALCRVVRTDGPLGGFQIRSYLDFGNPNAQRVVVEGPSASAGDGTGNDWAAEYFDGLGRSYLTARKGPSVNQTIYAETSFNERGQVAARTAPFYDGETPQTTSYGYDAFDRVVRVTHPDGNFISTSYGLLSQTTADENGKPVARYFDVFGRVVAEERFLSGQAVTTTSSYDLLGRLIGMQNDVGHQWSWAFDSLGRNYSKSDPDAGTWTFAYDDAGRLTGQTDAKGQTTAFGYDTAGRLGTKSNAAGTVAMTYSEARSSFFNQGRVTTVTAPGTTLQTDYDALGRAVRMTRNLDGNNYTVERRYDSGGFLVNEH